MFFGHNKTYKNWGQDPVSYCGVYRYSQKTPNFQPNCFEDNEIIGFGR